MRTTDYSLGLVQRARRALLTIPVVMAVALAVTALSSYRAIGEAFSAWTADQGTAVFETVREQTSGGSPSVEALQRVLERYTERGLRCLATLVPEPRRLVLAGRCATPVAVLEHALRTGTAEEWEDLGARVRLIRGQPRVLIELEPIQSRELQASASRTLGIGVVASLVLIATAVAYGRIALRAERQQEQSERDRQLAALGKMSAVLAHEIRNPLAAMKGHAQLLAEALPTTTREHDKAERVVSEAVRLEKLSSELLGFVRSQRIERITADPAMVLRKAAAAVGDQRVDFDLTGAPARWSMDVDKMQQVLRNVVRNALQASGDEGRVEASVVAQGDDLVFVVRDFGDGIAEDEMQQIFEPFFTTRVRGTGLGLAVARRIVELHGGEISASNHPDGGAVFRVAISEG